MKKPTSIGYFEQCNLGALVGSVLGYLLVIGPQLQLLKQRGAGAGAPVSDTVLHLSAGLVLLAWVGFVLLITRSVARRGAAWAKWVVIAVFGAWAVSLLLDVAAGTLAPGLASVLRIVVLALQGVAVWMLFKPASIAWFASRGEAAEQESAR